MLVVVFYLGLGLSLKRRLVDGPVVQAEGRAGSRECIKWKRAILGRISLQQCRKPCRAELEGRYMCVPIPSEVGVYIW